MLGRGEMKRDEKMRQVPLLNCEIYSFFNIGFKRGE